MVFPGRLPVSLSLPFCGIEIDARDIALHHLWTEIEYPLAVIAFVAMALHACHCVLPSTRLPGECWCPLKTRPEIRSSDPSLKRATWPLRFPGGLMLTLELPLRLFLSGHHITQLFCVQVQYIGLSISHCSTEMLSINDELLINNLTFDLLTQCFFHPKTHREIDK